MSGWLASLGSQEMRDERGNLSFSLSQIGFHPDMRFIGGTQPQLGLIVSEGITSSIWMLCFSLCRAALLDGINFIPPLRISEQMVVPLIHRLDYLLLQVLLLPTFWHILPAAGP